MLILDEQDWLFQENGHGGGCLSQRGTGFGYGYGSCSDLDDSCNEYECVGDGRYIVLDIKTGKGYSSGFGNGSGSGTGESIYLNSKHTCLADEDIWFDIY